MSISVIIPCYRAAATLRRAVDSALTGAPADLEVLLVDDGSSDDTGALCDELAAADPRVRALHRANGGAGAARNTGLDAAHGDWVLFLDADDALLPGLWAALDALTTDADMILFGLTRESSGAVKPTDYLPAGFCPDLQALGSALSPLLFDTGLLAAPYPKLFRCAAIGAVRFDARLAINEDVLFNIQFLQNTSAIYCLDGVYYKQYDTEAGSLSRRLRGDLLDAERVTRPALADLLTDLQLSGYDLGATGFDAAEVDDLFSQVHDKDVKDDDCELDAEEVTPFVKPGDLWTLGRHRMLCGDATSADDVDRLMDGLRANLVVTDPPYNVSYQSADGKSIQNDSMADGQFYEFLLAAFRNMAAHMAEGGSAYIFHADTEGLNFRRAFKEAGFHISGVCIWVKNSLVLGRSPYQWQHEPVLFGWLPNGKHKWFSDRKQSTIWNFDKPKRSKEHPTMKPIPLLAYPIKNSSAPNSIVLDLFGGSGSTLMACEQTDRICRTMELDPKYATAIVMRFANEYGTENIRLLRNGEELSYDAVAPQNSEHK